MVDSTWSATGRYGLAPAPAGLAFAQELLNTGLPAEPERDPLRSIGTARAWLDAAVSDWAARSEQDPVALEIGERDLPRLRRTRQALRDWLAEAAPSEAVLAPVAIGLGPAHAVRYAPGAGGAAGIESLVAVELLLASRAGTARRLKVCANPDCGAAFYDGSPNNSRRWHDVRTCGNVANLRASRARRRTAEGRDRD
jgi:predicted RNA-binding Zn ribbon-like protein